jgi:hypothetical protein
MAETNAGFRLPTRPIANQWLRNLPETALR